MARAHSNAALLCGFAVILGSQALTRAEIIRVPQDYPTIQEGIDAARDGDEVIVADGQYTGARNREMNFGGKRITVRSENGPANCTIQCQGLGRAFNFARTGEPPEAILRGFTIANGEADKGGGMFVLGASPQVEDCVFIFNRGTSNGGGAYIEDSATSLSGCVFVDNDSRSRAGGAYLSRTTGPVSNCTFTKNHSRVGGGGLYVLDGDGVDITQCIFDANSSDDGAGIRFGGGGIGRIEVRACLFVNNVAARLGGGLNFDRSGEHPLFTVRDCIFRGNTASSGGGMHVRSRSVTISSCQFLDNEAVNGGGLGTRWASPLLVNCRFIGNAAHTGGGMRNFDGSASVLKNCTFAGNRGEIGGGFISITSTARIANSIFWGNEGGAVVGNLADASFSCIEGGYPGIGIIDEDPLFLNPDNDDLRLGAGSPCIDAADNNAVPENVHVDLDGKPRFFDDPETEDTGRGDPPVVDMGAYEFQADLVGPIAPQRFEVVRGRRLLGGLLDLSNSDDRYLIVEARRPARVSLPSVEVVLESAAPLDDVAALFFRLEASALVPVPQWVDFYNFESDRWERLDVREATPNDSVVVVSERNDAGRFLQAETGLLRARVSWYDPGVSIAAWTAKIDQAVWTVAGR